MPSVHRYDHRGPATKILTVHSLQAVRTQYAHRIWLGSCPISRNPVPALQVSLTSPISAICGRQLPCRAGPRNENPVHLWCSSCPFAFLHGLNRFVSNNLQARSIPDGPADMPILRNHERPFQMSMALLLPHQQHAHRLCQPSIQQIERLFSFLIRKTVADQRLHADTPFPHQFHRPRQHVLRRIFTVIAPNQTPPLDLARVQRQRLPVIQPDQMQRSPVAHHLLGLRK